MVACTVVDYILTRLREQHVDTLFGVPSAFCAPLFDAAPAAGMTAVVTATDLEAGYAADGYARTRGLAAVSVAYGVGTLSLINAIAGAYVERSPIVVINGGPTESHLAGLSDLDVVFSHSIGRPDTDLSAYKLVTASAQRAATTAEVPTIVDTAIATAIRRMRPTYLEISKDLWNRACASPAGPLRLTDPPAGTEQGLAGTIIGLIRAARSPLILVGAEIQRYGLADQVADLITKLGVRWSTALLAKSVLAEQGKGWVGVYDPPRPGPAREAVEQADLLLTLGCVFPNGYAQLLASRREHIVSVYDGTVRIRGGVRQQAELRTLVAALVTQAATAPPRPAPAGVQPTMPAPATGGLTYRQVFERIGVALDDSWLVVPDTFLGVFSAARLPVKGRDGFLCGSVWASIGHSVAASVGASFGSPRRPLVVCGDGGFHMMAQALSTMVRYRIDPVVIVIDNGLYGYEQFILGRRYFEQSGVQPLPYVVLNRWDFVSFATAVGMGSAYSVDTASAFDAALAAAKASSAPALIVAKVDPRTLPADA
ncbi:thiamine pyrophosphate-binding protein [Micromonospora sp. FIMYZ51]|uniref:thiamine pyrophosphate-binding protein n=1 Tax=Micromonospora sp. FIMYZ51 TaxID=3051832 RepID=UPI00311DFF61